MFMARNLASFIQKLHVSNRFLARKIRVKLIRGKETRYPRTQEKVVNWLFLYTITYVHAQRTHLCE